MAGEGSLLLLLCLFPLSCRTEKPFSVVWNAPTQQSCLNKGVEIPLSNYSIIENDGNAWKGSQMVIFYETQLGNYPSILADGTLHNGGLPQLAITELQSHLAKARVDINRDIPDEDFTGYAVIDWEKWRPHWDRNWGGMRKYQELSRNLVRADHPEWNDTKVDQEARMQFEEAAKLLMVSTIELAKEMRPNGKWGFYLFPRCYIYDGRPECRNRTKVQNDHISWLFNVSTALYPSGYLYSHTLNASNFVHGQNLEAQRLRALYSRPETPILLYSRYLRNDDKLFYSKDELDASHQVSIDMGIEGVIIWGSSNSVSTPEKCQDLHDYVVETFGPYIKEKIDNAESCSVDECNSNGRCVRVDSLGTNDAFYCKCFPGYTGNECETEISLVM